MAHPDPSRPDAPRPDRRSSRPPARGQHPSLSAANAPPYASPRAEDFLGLDLEVQRAQAQAESMPQPPHLFAPPVAPDPRVSTNTTLIPRSSVFARAPVPPAPLPSAPQHTAPPQRPVAPPVQHQPAPPTQYLAVPPAQRTAPEAQRPVAPQSQHQPSPPTQYLAVPPGQRGSAPQKQRPVVTQAQHFGVPETPPSTAPQAQRPAAQPLQPLPPLPGTGAPLYQQHPFPGVRWPEDPARTNSWLLTLDDARSGRAGVEPVVHDPSRRAQGVAVPTQLDASFAEAPPVSSRTVPYLIRGLIGAAAASFLFVVGSTVLSPKLPDAPQKYVPPQVTSRIVVEPPAELSDPGPRGATPGPEAGVVRGRRTTTQRPVAQSPARPAIPQAAVPVRDEEPPTFIEVAPPEFAPNLNPNNAPPVDPNAANEQQASAADFALPPWDTGMVSTTPMARGELGPNADELAASPERKARVQSSLMRASRGASPVEDTNADYTPPVSTAGFTAFGSVPSAPPREAAAQRESLAKQTVPPSAPRAGGVWDGETVPVDQIAAKMRILTPRVGRVRVTLASGDVQEGRLHAVGEGQIWLEEGNGTAAIARTGIERLEQIGEAVDVRAGAGEKSAVKSAAASSEKRVRVRAAGGLFYGQIVARDGDTLTLLTDEGARVTIEGGSVEPAAERKTVVKRDTAAKPASKPKSEPLPPAHGAEHRLDTEVSGIPPAPRG